MALVRVLHILHSMNRGGAENAIMNYYRHIDRNKLQFDFLLTEQNKCQFEDEIISLGGRVYRVPLLKLLNPFSYLRAVSAFFDCHPEYRIVHSHTSSKSFFPLWIAKRKGIPVRIAHSHNTRSEKGFNGVIRDFLKILLKRVANYYYACGEEAAEWLYGSNYCQDNKVVILPNVIECKKFSYDENIRKAYRRNLNISEDELLLGYTGRLDYQKNPLFLAEIFKEIRLLNPKTKLIIVGDGTYREELTQRLQMYNLLDDVIFTGVIPNVSDYEQAMDLYIMPSFFEGLPLSLIEAQIVGLRCFVSTGIPKEADKTGLVTFIPLAEGAKKWADIILNNCNYNRRSYYEDLKKAGYDAPTSAIQLQDFYLQVLD